MKAPISLCIIVKDDPFIDKCILSLRDFVEEVVVVDTGSLPENQEVGRKHADIFEVFTACNNSETGLIEDFSMARQRSFDLATKPWVMWVDSDDIVENGHLLYNICNEYDTKRTDIDGIGYLFPYEYSYDQNGCTCRHYRERLFYNKNCFSCRNPVHEVICPKDGARTQLITREEIVFKHQRQFNPKPMESGRNLRILSKYFAETPNPDVRQMYYFGLELFNVGRLDESANMLSKYITLSGWDDERAMAALKLVDLYMAKNDLEEAVRWAFKAIEIKESWCEGYFALCKMYYFLAMKGGTTEQRYWEKLVHYAKIGFSYPPTQTLLFINPQDREYEIHKYYNMALNKLGDVKGALESASKGLAAQPNDPHLAHNKKLYHSHLAKIDITSGYNTLKDNGFLTDLSYGMLIGLLNGTPNPDTFFAKTMAPESLYNRASDGKPISNISADKDGWSIPQAYSFDSLPLKMEYNQLQATVLMVWRQYMQNNEILAALSFLENAPVDVRHSVITTLALNKTRNCISLKDDNANILFGKEIEKSTATLQLKQVSHLMANTALSVAEYFKKANIAVKDCYKTDTTIYVESYSSKPKNQNRLDIVFCIGDGMEVWTPETFKKTGLGGSETMAVENAKRLAALGHRVRVYVGCGSNGEGIYEGVEYYQSDKFQDLICDVLIVSRNAAMLADKYNIEAKLKLLWVHDIYACNATNELLLKADRIIALTEWHKQNIINVHNVHPAHVVVSRNGIDIERFANKPIQRNRFKCVNSSSPDRSWPILFECWPYIKAQCPEAELHLYYGFKNWELVAPGRPGQPELIARLKQQIKDLEPLGVVYHDRVSQKELAEEFLSAGVWAYCTWMSETSCVTAMEAQAAGLRSVTSAIAALNETVGDRGVLIVGDWTMPEYQKTFIEQVVAAMQKEDDSDRVVFQQYAKDHFCLDKLAKDWEKMFLDLIETKKTNPIVPYFPTLPYRNFGRGFYDGDTRKDNPNLIKINDATYIEKDKADQVEIVKAKKLDIPIIKVASKKSKPEISIIMPTMRVGGLDVVFESLKNQTFKNFEFIIVDGIYKYRKDIVAQAAKRYNFVVKHVEPTKNIFPEPCFCNTENTGLIYAEAPLILMITDYTYLPSDCVEKHINFHIACTAENYGYMCPHQYRSLPELHSEFPIYQQLDADKYMDDLTNNKLNNVMWSIFDKDFTIDPESLPLDSMGNADTKLFEPFGKGDQNAFNGKNESMKIEAALKINGWDEELDGTTPYQDNLFSDMLVHKMGFTWMVDKDNKVYIINPRFVMPWSKRLRPIDTNRALWKKKCEEGYKNPTNGRSIREERENILNKKTITIKHKPKISVIIPTNRVGGLDILFDSLKDQAFQDFELVLVDAIYKYRKDIVAEKSKQYNFVVKHIEPLNNTFPVSNYCRSMNTGLLAAEGDVVVFTCDYAYLDKDVLATHMNFHSNYGINCGLALPTPVYTINKSSVSKQFPKDKQYGNGGNENDFKLLIMKEEDYISVHDQWTDTYANDLKERLFDNVLWSIFDQPFNNVKDILLYKDRFSELSKDTPTIILQDLMGLKNDSYKREFIMNVNGMEEALDGTHGFQDTEFARRLRYLHGAEFYALNAAPANVLSIREYLEPRKVPKGNNNYNIIVQKNNSNNKLLVDNAITKWKEANAQV